MPRTLSASLMFLFLAFSLQAQEKTQKVKRPDLPGTFLVEFGFNRAQGTTPDKFEQGFWGSRTLNIYYQYPIRLWQTRFSYRPAAGFSFERYKLTNNYTLDKQISSDGSYHLLPASDLGMPNADKSMVIMNYFEIMPAEFRYDTNPEDPRRSIHVTAGVRVGVLFETHTKVNYSLNGESVTAKDAQSHGMNFVRLGYYGKLGVGSFSLFGYYNATPIFQENKGPKQTKMSTLTLGISLSGF